jgi:bacterioferritin
MDKEQIIKRLNWFYSLELNQVDLYISQSKNVDEVYLSKVFEHAAQIEQQHVDNIAQKIKDLGGTPTALGDVIAPIIGSIGGKIISLTGVVPMLKANILLEQKAMTDYQDFISKVDKDSDLHKLLWSNFIDEDFHTSWFSSKVQELESNP